MDAFALGLRLADRILEDGELPRWVAERYASYDEGIGASIERGKTSFAELERWVLETGEPERRSGRQESFENLLARYLWPR
jgi:xylose isomerase